MSVNMVVHPFSTSALGQTPKRSCLSLCVSSRWTRCNNTHFTSLVQFHRRSRSVRNFRLIGSLPRRPAEEKMRDTGVGNKQQRRGASRKPVNVVPVLRPVTDCRLPDRLRPDQTQGNGSREDRAGLRPPGKKGADPAGRNPGKSCCRP